MGGKYRLKRHKILAHNVILRHETLSEHVCTALLYRLFEGGGQLLLWFMSNDLFLHFLLSCLYYRLVLNGCFYSLFSERRTGLSLHGSSVSSVTIDNNGSVIWEEQKNVKSDWIRQDELRRHSGSVWGKWGIFWTVNHGGRSWISNILPGKNKIKGLKTLKKTKRMKPNSSTIRWWFVYSNQSTFKCKILAVRTSMSH